MHVEENRLPYFKKLISSLQVLRKQSAIFVVLDEILNCKHVNYRVKIAIKSFFIQNNSNQFGVMENTAGRLKNLAGFVEEIWEIVCQ